MPRRFELVRALSEGLPALLRPDDVGWRCDERMERAYDSRVVASRAERPYDCHGTDRTNRVASLPNRTASAPLRRLVRATAGDPAAQARRLSRQASTVSAVRATKTRRLSRQASTVSAPRNVIATPSPRHRMRVVQRSRRVTSRLLSGMRASRRSTTRTRSAGMTATTTARPHLEQRRVVPVDIRQHALDLAATAACEGEADAVGEPVAGDRTGRVEPLTLAQINRH
jgi:hypothetical protein